MRLGEAAVRDVEDVVQAVAGEVLKIGWDGQRDGGDRGGADGRKIMSWGVLPIIDVIPGKSL
jgi:hypothetical protein